MTASTLESRLRQIAVLVASVDTTAARQVLMHLPTEIAKRVRAMAADIGPIPPEERRALLAEFQKSQAQAKSNGNVQPATSRPDRDPVSGPYSDTAGAFADFVDQPGFAANTATETPSPMHSSSWTRLGVDALVRLLRLERPTVIAVVLQQLPPTQVAAVLQRLPRSTTKEALRALGSLQDIDEEAMRSIDEHLSERLRDYHHKVESELEKSRRVNELLAAAPPELKQQWASWMRPDVFIDEELAESNPVSATASAMNTLDNLYRSATITTSDEQWMAGNPAVAPMATTAGTNASRTDGSTAIPSVGTPGTTSNSNVTSSSAQQRKSATKDQQSNQEAPDTIPFPGVVSPRASSKAEAAERAALQKNMDRLLTLAPERLAHLLSNFDSQTFLLALAGASTQFMKRFRNMLEVEDSKVLDEQIQRIGPVSLRQIDEAQRQLVQSYMEFTQTAGLARAA